MGCHETGKSTATERFPLWKRKDGRWCKKIGGRHYYFGNVEDDPNGILALELLEKHGGVPQSKLGIKAVTYFAFDGKYMKIGTSNSLSQIRLRLSSLQTGNPRKIEMVCFTYIPELEVHALFVNEKVRGEWFRLSKRLLRFMCGSKCFTIRD